MSGKRKVALFSTNFLAWSQTFVYEQIRNHSRYDVEVFCKNRLNEKQFGDVTVHQAGPLYGAFRFSPLFDRQLKSGQFSLIHAHFGLGAIYALPFARRHNLPLAVTFHGYDVPLLNSHKRLRPEYWRYGFMGKTLLKELDLALCCSTELQGMVVELGVPAEKAVVHRLGIDIDAFSPGEPPSDQPQVIMIGRFVEKKGFEYGIKAFADQIHKGQKAHLTLVGDGELKPRLLQLIDDLNIREHVEMAGVLSGEEVAHRLKQSHVVLTPSVVSADGDRESGLIVAKEASASGVVPVGTWHGGIPEIIDDGVTGFLVPERDAATLSERLGQVLRDDSLRIRLAKAGRQKMELEYDNKKQVAGLEAHYDSVCSSSA